MSRRTATTGGSPVPPQIASLLLLEWGTTQCRGVPRPTGGSPVLLDFRIARELDVGQADVVELGVDAGGGEELLGEGDVEGAVEELDL